MRARGRMWEAAAVSGTGRWLARLMAPLLALTACGAPEPVDAPEITVAVAANFLEAHEVLVERFEARSGARIVTSAGSTGQLFAQILNGAPYDVFLAADSVRPGRLEREGEGVRGTRLVYARGRLALYGPTRDSVRAGGADLGSPEVRNIAIANPRIAPYGAAAVATMDRLETEPDGRLVQGESIGQTLQFVISGAAEFGFVALSQVLDEPPESYWVVPAEYHPAIVQEAILLRRAEEDPVARAYLDFLATDEARALIEAFGYSTGGLAQR